MGRRRKRNKDHVNRRRTSLRRYQRGNSVQLVKPTSEDPPSTVNFYVNTEPTFVFNHRNKINKPDPPSILTSNSITSIPYGQVPAPILGTITYDKCMMTNGYTDQPTLGQYDLHRSMGRTVESYQTSNRTNVRPDAHHHVDIFDVEPGSNPFGSVNHHNTVDVEPGSNPFGSVNHHNTVDVEPGSNPFGFIHQHNIFDIEPVSNSFGSVNDDLFESDSFSLDIANSSLGYHPNSRELRNVFETPQPFEYPFPTDIFPPSYEPFVDNDFNPTTYVTIGDNQFPSAEVLFVYEKLDRNHCLSPTTLESEELFCDRWMKATKLYVVQQGPYQFGVAKHLQHPHYQLHAQLLYDHVCHFEKTNPKKIDVQSIDGSQSFSDDFMYVTNLVHDDKFPWELIRTALDVYCTGDKSRGDPLDGRQRTFVDFGYCSHQSTKRNGIGIACANKLVGTNSAIARALFSNTHLLIDACKDATFTSGFGSDCRRTHFASELGDGNLFETIRCHETSADALCNIHTDNHNGKEDGYTLVY